MDPPFSLTTVLRKALTFQSCHWFRKTTMVTSRVSKSKTLALMKLKLKFVTRLLCTVPHVMKDKPFLLVNRERLVSLPSIAMEVIPIVSKAKCLSDLLK